MRDEAPPTLTRQEEITFFPYHIAPVMGWYSKEGINGLGRTWGRGHYKEPGDPRGGWGRWLEQGEPGGALGAWGGRWKKGCQGVSTYHELEKEPGLA